MTIEHKLIQTDEDLLNILPLVLKFARTYSDGPGLWELLRDVCNSIGGTTLCMCQLTDSQPTGYLCGYFLNPVDFVISQAYSENGKANGDTYKEFERVLIDRGVKRLMLYTNHEPQVFSRYGFKLRRYFMTKEVGKDGNV